MKIAKLNSVPIQTTREGVIDNYYVVNDNYNFTGNSATDVTSYDNLTTFYAIGRFSEKLHRESLINNVLPSFNSLSASDKKNLVLKRIYPSGFTQSDIENIVGVMGYELINRTYSFTEFIQSGDSAFNTYVGVTAPSLYVTSNKFNTYTGTTTGGTGGGLPVGVFAHYTGVTAHLTFQSKSSINTLTGTTLPQTYQNKSSIVVLTGTTLPNQYAAKSAFLGYTGTTAPVTFQSKASINTLTGTTLPLVYQSKSSIVTLTGTTLPLTYQNKSSIATFTGTTAPATYLSKTAFNTYTGTSAGISSANNGLTKNGTNVRLGGTLTGETTIDSTSSDLILTGSSGFLTLGRNTGIINISSRNAINIVGKNVSGVNRVIFRVTSTGTTLSDANSTGIQYAANYSAGFTARSLVDKGYVTGLTSTLATQAKLNTYTGTTAPATFVAKTVFSTYTGGTTNVTTANNGIRKNGNNVRLGGSLTGSTNIGLGTSNLTFTGTTGTLRYGSDVSANYNVRSLVDKGYVTGLTSQIVYGTEYQLASALATTTTTSTTPVAKVTMVTTNLPSGTYKITVHWLWLRDSTANSARFNVTIGGVAQGTRSTIEVEAGDVTDIRPETRIFYVALSGVNTIVFNHWAESNANITSTSDATIELHRVS